MGRISPTEFVKDVRLGFTDRELLEKYLLSEHELQTVFRRCFEADLLDLVEFRAWLNVCNENVPLKQIRLYRRDTLNFTLLILKVNQLKNPGRVVDISQYGLGTRGIRTAVNRLTKLTIPEDDSLEIPEMSIHALCQWAREDSGDGDFRAGFNVRLLAREGNWNHFRRIVKSLIAIDQAESWLKSNLPSKHLSSLK